MTNTHTSHDIRELSTTDLDEVYGGIIPALCLAFGASAGAGALLGAFLGSDPLGGVIEQAVKDLQNL